MTNISIKKGDQLLLNGSTYEFLRKVQNGFLFEEIETGEIVRHEMDELVNLLYSGKATLNPRPTPPSDAAKYSRQSFDLFPQHIRDIALERLEFVKAYEAKLLETSRYQAAQWAIRDVAEQLGAIKKPSIRSLQRWYLRWTKGRRHIQALMPLYGNRGGGAHRISEEVLRLAHDAIEAHYMKRNGENISGCYEELKEEIRKINAQRSPATRLECPSLSTLNRLVAEIDIYTRTTARQGQRAADRMFRSVGGGPVANYPLHIVQIDHTKLDVITVGEDGDILGRCWLTIALDLYSRMVVGFHLSMNEPRYASVMQCLRNALMPKHLAGNPFNEVADRWPCFGVMSTVVLDNGLEFHSKNLLEACAQLGVDIQYCPAYTPHYKGAVERFFGTLNTKLIHTLPGTTFSNPKQRGDYKSEQEACLTFEELYQLLAEFVSGKYALSFHKGIGKTPYSAWLEGVNDHPVRVVQSKEDVEILTAYFDDRKLTRKGVEIFGLRYNSEELDAIRLRHLTPTIPSHPVKVKYDPVDIGQIYVADEEGQTYRVARCTSPEYAAGLSLWQHNIIKSKVRKRLKAGESASLQKLVGCRDRCFAIVQEAEARKQKPSRRHIKTFATDRREFVADEIAPASMPDQPSDPELSLFLDPEELSDLAETVDWSIIHVLKTDSEDKS